MLHWIEVDVIHVSRQIAFIANRVLPKAPLPHCEFATMVAHEGAIMGDPLCVKRLLMRRHRPEKSASSAGRVMTICK